MRVQRALAQAGVASRRAAERLIAEGRVEVNGRPAEIGQVVGQEDDIRVDGRATRQQTIRALLLHKPAGAITTARDAQGRPTVLDELPRDVRVYPVGRLDRDTTGALLLTNDGELAHRLMHPRSGVPKVYEALLRGRVSAHAVKRLRLGVELEDGPTLPARVEVLERRAGSTLLRVQLTEGRNRQVRRMAEAVGHRVIRLTRTRYDGLDLRGLAPGEWRSLRPGELADLRALVGLGRR